MTASRIASSIVYFAFTHGISLAEVTIPTFVSTTATALGITMTAPVFAEVVTLVGYEALEEEEMYEV